MQTVINSETLEVRIDGVGAVTTWLKTLDGGIRKNLRKAGTNVGFLVQREGRRRAPYREGNLERAITFESGEGYVKIFVPVNSPAGRYAEQKHNGRYNLGAASRAKGPQVGPKFLTRAIKDNEAKIQSLFKAGIDKI
jgi:hypothetical protein